MISEKYKLEQIFDMLNRWKEQNIWPAVSTRPKHIQDQFQTPKIPTSSADSAWKVEETVVQELPLVFERYLCSEILPRSL